MELYAQLTDDELVYVTELQRCFGDTCCYFVQWILSAETKELVNSARISALQLGTGFTWAHTRAEILRSLTDVKEVYGDPHIRGMVRELWGEPGVTRLKARAEAA